jgi:outer membrane protein insertion porin family
VSLQAGRQTDYYTLSFTEPYLFDRRVLLGASIYKTNMDIADFYRETTGASVTIGLGLKTFGSLTALLAYEDVFSRYAVSRTGYVGDPTGGHDRPLAPPPLTEEELELTYELYDGKTTSLTPAYGFDSRDDPFDPNRGTRFTLRSRFAGGPFGGDFDYYRPELSLSRFLPHTKRSLWAFNIEAGQFFPYDDSEIPLYERYRLGGDRTLRGIPYYTVSPRTKDGDYFYTTSGSKMGGDRYWLLNLEYQFRLGGPVKLVLFGDLGNTYHEDQGWDFGLFRKTTGLELRIFLPIFQAPIRFIYGYNLEPFDDEDTSDFQFSIGTTF